MKRFFGSLRFRLIALVLLATIPALVITYLSGMDQRELARQQAVTTAYRYTRLAADYQIGLVNTTRSLLQFLSRNTDLLNDAQACEQYITNLHAIYTQYNSMLIATPAGDIYCASPKLEQPVFIGDRPYFQETLQSKDFVIGETITGRLTNRLIQPFAMPMLDSQGEIRGVVLVTMNLDALLAYSASLQLPPQSAVLVVDDQGTVITRYPLTEELVGQNLNGMPLIQQILAQRGEGNAETTGVDGTERLYAFTPMQSTANQDLFISIGIPTKIAYESADRLMRQTMVWIGLATSAALLLAWFGGDVWFLRVVSLTAERDLAEKRLQEANKDLELRVAQRTEELARANDELQNQITERERMVVQLQRQEINLRGALVRLKQSNRDLQDFAYIASHDMQEPLRKIQAFSERLDHRFADDLPDEGRDFLQRISASANRMQTMINALLTFSRLNTKGQQFEPTNLSAVLADVLTDLEIRIHETGAQVIVEDLPTIDADPNQISQLFTNLIGNALKFQQPGETPVVRVRTEAVPQPSPPQDHAMIRFVVEDNGIGFDEKYLDRIFKPFQRLHNRSEYEGSGIGLAICRKIVERMNGTIAATSTPGQGSRFIVTLPLKQTTEKEPTSSEYEP